MEPFSSELRHPRFWVLVGIGVFCLLASAVLSLQTTISDARLSDAERLAAFSSVWYENRHVLINILHEIGFASLIALLIFILVERAAKLEQHRSADELLRRVSQNVLEASFGIRANPDIVRHVITHILAAPVIRTGMRQTFTLEALPTELSGLQNYIVMRVASSYEIENVSGGTIQWPVRVLLPKTRYSDLDELVCVTACSIAEKGMTQGEIQAGYDESENWEKRYSWVWTLEKNQSLNIAINYQAVKEISDNEAWTNLLNTQNMEVVVDNRIPGLYWSLTPRTSAKIIPVDAPTARPWGEGRILFRVVEPMLAYQGFTIWWQPPP
jgi:hypothetical protein